MSRIRALAFVAGTMCVVAMAIPQEVTGQRSAVEVWSANCGRCHTVQPPDRYYAKDWASILQHMTVTARLTGAEADAITQFLISGARRGEQGSSESMAIEALPAGHVRWASWSQTVPDPEAAYNQQCAPCHGKEGHGDGPAATAFNPKPTDFENAEFWAERSDQQIDSVITAGKGSMPPMPTSLTPDMRAALIKYLREKFGEKWVRKADGS